MSLLICCIVFCNHYYLIMIITLYIVIIHFSNQHPWTLSRAGGFSGGHGLPGDPDDVQETRR